MGNCSSLPPDYEIIVKTGDVKGAGTDANVYCALVAVNGTRSRDFHLDCRWKNDFEKGNVDSFKVANGTAIGPLKKIEIWRDDSGLGDDWYVEWIKVKNILEPNSELDVFPCHRWVKAERKLILTKYDCMLPQFDDHPEQRKRELEEKRELYRLVRKAPGIPKQIESCPRDESFSNDYKWNIQQTKYKLAVKCKLTKLTSDPWEKLEDLDNVYKGSMGKPYGLYNWKEDSAFSRQRLQGCNPTMIELCREIPENFAVTSEMVEPFLDGMTLEEAINAKRIYICNLITLSDIVCRFNRLISKPMALFFVNNSKELMPIAIQLFQKPAEDNPVFLPSDPKYTWMLAKMYYNNADAAFHQSCTHLGFTHLVAETICVGTHRQVSPSHPVFRLLAPHFLYLLAINSLALARLVSPNGWIDICMQTGAEGLMGLCGASWKKWRMNVNGWLPKELKERGVDDAEALPNYPYRDDALLIHQVIWDYVREVLEAHYDSPDKLQDDYEIQNWGHMLADPEDGLGVQGVFGDGKFTDLEDLIKTVTSIIFISSVGHAAANFAQYDEYAFPPNYPAFLRGKPPTSKEELTEKDIIDHIPLKDMTLDIMLVTKILSDRGTNPLGDFEVQYQYDPIGTKAVENFRRKLTEVSAVLDERNKTRPFPYPYLNPKEIPNAISI
ncbi:polyunsaturated fatty acid 5-lipoxygenase isoform X2 [Nematostella vectensis]|uniref:polyunsaturated fatty acid 5-lipoxygenase isoform X2 n=1 Tax=Nematostella vectensis TaxID=45351 RepID=UPI00139014C3|nr:polyunsaturated fatty acid 5-lipoxygenase isoform X2 [Nematostella vectensis]